MTIVNLGDATITTAVTDSVITESSVNGAATTYISISGAQSLTVWARLDYGSSGTTVAAIVQTSIDGVHWIDILRFDFLLVSRSAHGTVGCFANVAPATLATLSAEGKLDGILGDRVRCKVTSTGTYAGNTTLSVRAVVR